MSDPAPRLGAAADRVAVHDLLARYAKAVDAKDLAGVRACFTADASYRGSLGEGPIGAILAALGERWGRYRSTSHFLGLPLVELDGDRASAETTALVYHRYESDGAERDLVVGVRYVDELVREGDSWRIQRRVATVEWQREDPVVPAAELS